MGQCLRPVPVARVLKSVITVAVLLFAVAPASAASRQAQERLARKACLNGDYAKGVSLLSDLFVDTQDPTYIFNQGRCLEQNRRYEEAAARFEEYLRVADAKLTPEDRAAAEKHISDCKSKLPKPPSDSPVQPPTQPLVAPTPPPVPEPTPQPAPSESATQVVAQPAPQPVEGERRWGLVTAGIITSAVGVGGVATGLIFNLKANDAAKELETKVGAYPAKSNDERKYKTLAWVGYGAGAACVVTGAVLIAVGAVKSSPSSSTAVAFVPAFGPGQVGALLTGAF
jgi:tetratricopeptide (TPR) repeat protein